MAKGEVLQIVVFAFIFGAACATVGTKARPVVQFCESLSEIMFQYTNYVMLFAPFGVFGAMAATIGENGHRRADESGQTGSDAYTPRNCFSSWWCWAL